MPRYKKPAVIDPTVPEPHANNGVYYKPETKGRKKVGVLDWSLDELIEYKHNGTPPCRIPDRDVLYKLGKFGVSAANAADLFGISLDKFFTNTDWHESWKKGRAEVGSRVRASIVEDALEKDNLMAKIYIDKIMGGDKESNAPIIQVQVNNQLGEVSTEDLLTVVYKDTDNPDDNKDTESN